MYALPNATIYGAAYTIAVSIISATPLLARYARLRITATADEVLPSHTNSTYLPTDKRASSRQIPKMISRQCEIWINRSKRWAE